MNVVWLVAIALTGFGLIWAGQSVALVAVGEPLAWPLRFKTKDPRVKMVSRVMIHSVWVLIILIAPFMLGHDALSWAQARFPTPVPWREMAIGFVAMLTPIWVMYGAYLAIGLARYQPKFDDATRRRKLVKRFLLPWPLATLEEAVFRGLLLELVLSDLPQTPGFMALGIIVTAAIFSSLHFVKPHDGSRAIRQPAYGLFLVGCLFGLAYVVGGRTLWLPIVVHGTAVFGIEIVRLYIAHNGPPWLIGYSEFPQSGVVGTFLVCCVAAVLVWM